MNRVSRFSRVFGIVAVVIAAVNLLPSLPAQTKNSPPPAPRRPSIIFILTDDLGYGDLSCYGQTNFATPNIDKLAKEGVRFTSCYAGSTVCTPSRAALMLGQHTGHLNLRGNVPHGTLLPGEVTVAEVLKQAGYHTCLIGKWGLADEGLPGVPQKMGFDEFVGYLENVHAHDYYPEYLWRYDPPQGGKQEFDGKAQFPENADGRKGLYIPDLCTKAALNFVRYSKPDEFNRYRPFFLCLNYTTPHANDEEGQRSGNGMQVPTDAPYSDAPWPQPEKNKAAMISRMDGDIGRLLAKLKELKIDDDTVIFFSSDNGPHKEGGVNPDFFQSSGPFRGHKRDLTEGGIRVPMIVRWPGKIKPGASDFPWAFWDFLPTAADIARTKAPKGIDGLSVLPLLLGRTQTNRHEYFYWEFHERGFQQAMRMGDWKAIRPQAGEKLELYNLKTDPGEKKDVADQNPDVVKKIEELLKTARTDSPRWPIKKMTAAQIAEEQRLAREYKLPKPPEAFKLPQPPEAAGTSSGKVIPDFNPSASGTGFFISEDGFLVTNEHLVRNARQIRLVTSAGLISAKVVKVDAANDLALLKAEGKFSPLPVAASRTVKLGATVATVGFPNIGLQGFAPKLAKGEIASLSGAGDDARYFQISVPVQPGNSGGALVDERGDVVGVVAAKLNAVAALTSSGALPENVNYAVKSSYLLSFLESLPEVSAKLKEPSTKDKKFEDVVQDAEQAAILVLVY